MYNIRHTGIIRIVVIAIAAVAWHSLYAADGIPQNAGEHCTFEAGLRYSELVINSRINDFKANTTASGFGVFDHNRKATLSVRPDDGKLIIRFDDETTRSLCDEEEFTISLDSAFSQVMGKEVGYELITSGQMRDRGQFYPDTSVFGGMEVTVDDDDFK